MRLRQLAGGCFVLALIYAAYLWSNASSAPSFGETHSSSLEPANKDSSKVSPEPIASKAEKENIQASFARAFSKTPTKMTSRNLRAPTTHNNNVVNRKVLPNELMPLEILPGSSWLLVSTLVAVPVGGLARAERSAALGELSGFAIFDAPEGYVAENDFTAGQPFVVYNSRTKSYGILTGTLQVSMRDHQDVQTVAREHGLKVQNSFQDINLYFVTAQAERFSLQQLKLVLEQDARIQTIEVEIVSHRYAKN